MIAFLKQRLLAAGIHVERRGVYNDPDLRLKRVLDLLSVSTIIDIGANEGQFARSVFASGYRGRVISFEPLAQQNGRMQAAAAGLGGRWIVAPPCALGNSNGTVEFNAAKGHAASSVLQPNKALTDLGTQYATLEKRSVRLARLDDVMAADYPGCERSFIKVDVQGYELDVLKGGANTLAAACGVKLEMSLAPLYEGQALADEIHGLMLAGGFVLWDLEPGFRDRNTGRLLQYDGLYIRADKASV